MFLYFLRIQLPDFHEAFVLTQIMEARTKLALRFTADMRTVFWASEQCNDLTALLAFEDVFADRMFSTSLAFVLVEALCISEGQATISARNCVPLFAVHPEATSTLVGTKMFESLFVPLVTAITPVGLFIPSLQTGEQLKVTIMMKDQNFCTPFRSAIDDRICMVNRNDFDLMVWQNLDQDETSENASCR